MLHLKFLLLYSFMILICSLGVPGSQPECDELEWKCDSGECIDSEMRCDGIPNCADGSDETAEHCIQLKCPRYAFRCSYGACIAGNAKCNGVRDCADNSDEFEFVCSNDDDYLEKILQGNCSEPITMQCKSGECIDSEYRCDGVPNCIDGSDEIVEVCSHIFCPSYAFHCGYGGCIPGHDKCDGKIDCLDGSDEAAELCGYDRGTNATRKKPQLTPPKKWPNNATPQGCFIPYDRKNLIVVSLGTSMTNYKLGDHVATETKVEFTCPLLWQLKGKKQNLCINNKWVNKVPICQKFCSVDTIRNASHISTRAECFYNNKKTSCVGKHLRIGTQAEISCAPGYRLPTTQKKVQHRLTCDEDAEWDYPKVKCVPDCGTVKMQQNILISEMPWEISIFRRKPIALYSFTCSGAIISPKIIISASNCYSQSSHGFGNDPLYYNAVEGRKRDTYTHGATTDMIIHNISEIILPDNPVDQSIAILVLVNYIEFSSDVKPICLPKIIGLPTEMYFEVDAFGQQNAVLVRGSALSTKNGSSGRYFLDSIVVEKYEDGTLKLIRTAFFMRNFIKRAVNRFLDIL